jgi:hypothetical protein
VGTIPADPNVKVPGGSNGYPETVLFRLITSKGGPNVKLTAQDDGAGLVLAVIRIRSGLVAPDESVHQSSEHGRTRDDCKAEESARAALQGLEEFVVAPARCRR